MERHPGPRGVMCPAGGKLVKVCCMTQPAVHGQLPQDAPQETPRFPLPGAGQDAGSGRPAPGPASAPRRGGRPPSLPPPAFPVGLLWWLLAPSGLNLLSGDPDLRSGGNTEGWLPRDLVLAGLFLLAGCISGAVASGSKHHAPTGRDVVLAVGAGALGALAAWGTGRAVRPVVGNAGGHLGQRQHRLLAAVLRRPRDLAGRDGTGHLPEHCLHHAGRSRDRGLTTNPQGPDPTADAQVRCNRHDVTGAGPAGAARKMNG